MGIRDRNEEAVFSDRVLLLCKNRKLLGYKVLRLHAKTIKLVPSALDSTRMDTVVISDLQDVYHKVNASLTHEIVPNDILILSLIHI